MDIIQQVQALNTRIATLESSNTELLKRVGELTDQNERLSALHEVQLAHLRNQLEQETQQHSFTRLELEDEQRNVALGVRMLRELQSASGDVASLRTAIQEKDSTITRLQQELSAEREMRASKEREASKATMEKESESASRTALKSMVSLLTTQLRQSSSQLSQYDDIIKGQKEEIGRGIDNLKRALESPFLPQTDLLAQESPNGLLATYQDRYVEELDAQFKAVLDLLEEAEGRPLTADIATPIKAAIRDAKQVIGEEIIIAHSNQKMESLLRHNTAQQLQNERSLTSSFLTVISDLQAQVDSLLKDSIDVDTIRLSFTSAGPVVLEQTS
jgi:hypothetical protein